jgi:hypothetical protein
LSRRIRTSFKIRNENIPSTRYAQPNTDTGKLMKYMKKYFIVLYLLSISIIGNGQELIESAKISLELPNNKWELKDKVERNGREIYYFKRDPIKKSDGVNVIPNISIIVEDLKETIDVVTYSAIKRGQVHFDVIKTFIHEDGVITFKNAIGYKGKYNDVHGEHTVYVIHGINNNKGIQIIFDVLTELFDHLDPEFKVTLKSIMAIK